MYVDLHVHSTASDGTDTPSALAAKAAEAGLQAIALTDHDTVAGIPAFIHACQGWGVEALAGVEISALYRDGHGYEVGVHILGYFPGGVDPRMEESMGELMSARDERNKLMVQKLNQLGIPLCLDEVAGKAGGDVVGRVHMAQVLVEGGYVSTMDEAFRRYLGPRGKAYAPKERLTPEEAIQLISRHGGLAVLAHPGTLPIRGQQYLESFSRRLVQSGLGGIESDYPYLSNAQRQHFRALARRLGVVATGGSDYHGANRPEIRLGRGDGSLELPYAMVEAIRERWKQQV
ncbi:PHP domain-containing protein [Desulfurispira natronophila]|uniref:Polymerase/histidinol phosphatase N-terminal domain-containing protein n=1 Tax=Desulfurispira natronophila TaxID=682562 RepID=A0A7W7Y5W2_9BACT|nr:PHP domain-containing protein [Desulfurispira natronophila]MBB5022675.1 hypothetical protein [Desulfurispira natronophila]